MAPVQRRRGQLVLLYRSKLITDARGNKVLVIDEDNPYEVLAWTFPQRSSQASLAGQQDIDVVRFGTVSDLSGINAWSALDYQGYRYDVVSPPAFHHGTRHVRHWSIDARRRPNG